MTPILLRTAAAADVEQAFTWYENRRAGLGEEFLSAFRAAINDIAVHPLLYPVIHRNTRRALMRRFPYGLFYRVYDETVIIVACMHGRSDPKRWQSRL